MKEASFKAVFIAIVLATGIVIASLILNSKRPSAQVEQPNAAMVEATGKCATCHRRETSAIVHQFELSKHHEKGITCLDCHRAVDGQTCSRVFAALHM